MRRLRGHVILLALAALLLTSCGGIKVSARAVDEIAAVVKGNARTIELNGDQVGTLASQARVSDDVVRDVAPQLDKQPLWRTSLNGVQTIYDETPPEVRSNLIGIACNVLTGQIQTQEELYQDIAQRFRVYTQDQLNQILSSAEGLWRDLLEASNSDDEERRAAAVIACFIAEEVTG